MDGSKRNAGLVREDAFAWINSSLLMLLHVIGPVKSRNCNRINAKESVARRLFEILNAIMVDICFGGNINGSLVLDMLVESIYVQSWAN